MSRWLKIGLPVVVVIALLAGAAWWLGFFDDTPEEVSIDAAREAATEAAAEDGADDEDEDGDGAEAAETSTTVAEEPEEAAEPAASDEAEPLTDLTGSWTVVGGGSSFVGYRIDEVLNTVGDFTVVGRTEDVTGTIAIDGTQVTAADFVADMTTLTTDNGGRDRAMRGQALETDEFPEATFALTAPIEIGGVPAEGETVDLTASGDLTIHGVTQAVEFPLTAATEGGSLIVIGQLDVLLADYDIAPPSAPVVASVEDNAILELSLVLEQG